VLAWESGFFDCRDFAAALRGDRPLADAAQLCLYGIWSKSREVEPTLAYVRATQATARPIDTVGFDSRVSTETGRRERFPRFVIDFFDRLDPALISESERADLTAMSIGLVPADYYAKPGPRNWNRELPRRLIATLDARRAELEHIYPPHEVDWARQSLVSFLAMDHALPADAEQGNADGYTRDTAMAENLLWWLDGPLKGRKVMVWAHNYHVGMDFPSASAPASRPQGGPTGRFLKRALGDGIYTLGFLTHHGSHYYAGGGFGQESPEAIPAPPAGSLEDLLHGQGKPYLFQDLKSLPEGHWLRQPQTAGAYFYEPQQIVWPRLYDGFFFIDEMKPSTERSQESPSP
jgi:erythromycin esterase